MSTNRYGKDTTSLVSDTENSQMTCIMKKKITLEKQINVPHILFN